MTSQRAQLRWLLIGDTIAILIVTIIGFLDHYREIAGWRWLTTFLPVLLAWLAVAPWLGVYQENNTSRASQLWRPVLAAILAAPLAAILRGFWLSAAVLPIFALVLGLTNALGLVLWRLGWVLAFSRVGNRVESHG